METSRRINATNKNTSRRVNTSSVNNALNTNSLYDSILQQDLLQNYLQSSPVEMAETPIQQSTNIAQPTTQQTQVEEKPKEKQALEGNFFEVLGATVADLGYNLAYADTKAVENVFDFFMGLNPNWKETVQRNLTGEIFEGWTAKNEETQKSSLLKWGDQYTNNMVTGTVQAVGEQLPRLALALLTSGVSEGVSKGLTTAMFVTGAYGGGIEEAYNEGATYGQALTYGALSASVEMLTEQISNVGGMTDKMFFKGVFDDAIKNVSKNMVVRFALGMVGEGVEEAVSEWLEPKIKYIAYQKAQGKEYEAATWQEIVQAGLIGALSSGILQGGNVMATNATKGSFAVATLESDVRQGYEELYKLCQKENTLIEKQNGYLSQKQIDSFVAQRNKIMNDINNSLAGIEKRMSNMSEEKAEKIKSKFEKSLGENNVIISEYDVENGKFNDTFKANFKLEEVVGEKNLNYKNVDFNLEIDADSEISNKMKNKLVDAARVFRALNSLTDEKATIIFTDKLGKDENGRYQNGKLYVNVNSDNIIKTIVGHEFTHFLEKNKLYADFKKFVIEQFKKDKALIGEYEEILNKYKESYQKKLGKEVSTDYVDDEILADFVGEYLATDDKFINSLREEKPNIFKKLASLFKKASNSEIGKLTTEQKEFVKEVKNKFVETAKSGKVENQEEIRYAITKDNKLIAVHNLSENKLLNALELGGFPMPSIAVLPYDKSHVNFGDISIIFKESTVDPKKSSKNKIYGGDAWTTTFPTVEYTVDKEAYKDFESHTDKYRKLLNRYTDFDEYFSKKDIADMFDNLKYNNIMKAWYLEDKGDKLAVSYTTKKPRLYAFNDKSSQEEINLYREQLRAYDKYFKENYPQYKGWNYNNIDTEDVLKERENISKYVFKFTKEWFKTKEGYTEKWDNILYHELDLSQALDFLNDLQNELDGRFDEQRVDSYALDEYVSKMVSSDDKGYQDWLLNKLMGVERKPYLRNNKSYYTDYGYPRTFNQLHSPFTLENAVRIMAENKGKGVNNGWFGANSGTITAANMKEYKSINEVKQDLDRVAYSDEQYEKDYEMYDERLKEIAFELEPYKFSREAKDTVEALENMGYIRQFLQDVAATDKSDAAIKRLEKEWHFDKEIPSELVTKMQTFFGDLNNKMVKYFEAKPIRPVTFDEIQKIILPDKTSDYIKSELKKKGVEVIEYTNENPREQIIRNDESIRFSINFSQEDTENQIKAINRQSGTIIIDSMNMYDAMGYMGYSFYKPQKLVDNFEYKMGNKKYTNPTAAIKFIKDRGKLLDKQNIDLVEYRKEFEAKIDELYKNGDKSGIKYVKINAGDKSVNVPTSAMFFNNKTITTTGKIDVSFYEVSNANGETKNTVIFTGDNGEAFLNKQYDVQEKDNYAEMSLTGETKEEVKPAVKETPKVEEKKEEIVNETRKDDFETIQRESRGMSDEELQRYRDGSQKISEELFTRLQTILRRELESRLGSDGNRSRVLDLGNGFSLYENVDGETFHDVFEITRHYLEYGELVDLHEVEDTEEHGIGYKNTYNYLSKDGLSGFAITPDGDLISVFNANRQRGFLRAIAPIIKEKAKTLDCYVSYKQNLRAMYARVFGFQTASLMAFNMKYDHDNIAVNHKKPRVAFMVNTERQVEMKNFKKDQYAEAVEYRDSFLKEPPLENPPVKSQVGRAEQVDTSTKETGIVKYESGRKKNVSKWFETARESEEFKK